MVLRKATKEEYEKITRIGIFILKDTIGTKKNGFIEWKKWINSHYDFGEVNPSLLQIMHDVLGIE